MASAIMHLCIAKKVNEEFKRNTQELYLGAIAPDLSKEIGMDKTVSHFGKNFSTCKFKRKYPKFYNNDFELGYYIHILSDKIWYKKFMKKVIKKNKVKFLNGKKVKVDLEDIQFLVYEDYTNLNVDLIDHYNLPLKLFFDDNYIPKTRINEIDVKKLQILVDKMGIILRENDKDRSHILDLELVIDYIDYTSLKIIKKLRRKALKNN